MLEHHPKITSLRVAREVEPSRQVAQFLKRVTAISVDEAGYSAAAMHRISPVESLDGPIDDDASYERLGIPKVHVYPENGLRLTLFERHAPASIGLGSAFAKGLARVSSPYRDTGRQPRHNPDDDSMALPERFENPVHVRLKQAGLPLDIPETQHIKVRFESVQQVLNPMYEERGREYALVPECSAPETELLYSQATIITEAFASLGYGDDIVYPEMRSALNVPFMRVPSDVAPSARHQLLQRVQRECLPFSPYLGEIDWGSSSKS